MITSAIGKPTTNAPPIVNANAESRFSADCNSCEDMSLLHRAPTGMARRPRINDQETSYRDKVLMAFKKALPCAIRGWRLMVNKGLTQSYVGIVADCDCVP
jgi:hypothetical protein